MLSEERFKMNRFERWFLKRLCKKLVVQGRHKERITEYYRIMYEAARTEFTEDNKPTLDTFMLRCFKDSH